MGTTQQEDMTNTTPQVENVVNETSQELHLNDLANELLIIEERWRVGFISKYIWKILCHRETMIDSVEKLENEIYRFRIKYKGNPEYNKLLIHIKNKIIIDNNVHTETSSIATLMIAFAAFLVSLYNETNIIITISKNLLLIGTTLVIFASVGGVFKGRVKQKNFYEICLNILDKQNSDQ